MSKMKKLVMVQAPEKGERPTYSEKEGRKGGKRRGENGYKEKGGKQTKKKKQSREMESKKWKWIPLESTLKTCYH